MENTYILGGLRTPIVVKNGRLKNVQPEDFCAEVLRQLIRKYRLEAIDAVICGNAVGTGGNITRLMALKAGVSPAVPAFTVDMQCASAAMSIDIACAKIASGQCDLVIAGGLESSSLQPLRAYSPHDSRYTQETQGIYAVAQFSPEDNQADAMLQGAQRTAQQEGVTKAELDFWALESHRRARAARESRVLADLIVPIDGNDKDDGIRERMNQRLLDRLPPLLGEGTLLTAGNTCLVNDGAALVVLCSQRYLEKYGHEPLAQVIASQAAGGEPQQSPRLAMAAADRLLDRIGLGYADMAAIEFNEAFAVIDVLFQRRHPELIDCYNTFGGALAYGHPYGASGAIILLHLLRAIEQKDGGYGICSIAGAGGTGCALLVKGTR